MFPVLSEFILPHTNITLENSGLFQSYVSGGHGPSGRPLRILTCEATPLCHWVQPAGGHYVLSTMLSPLCGQHSLVAQEPAPLGPVLPGAPACVCVLGSSIPPLSGPTHSHVPLPQPLLGALTAAPTSLAHGLPGQFSVHTQRSGVHVDGKHSSSFSFLIEIER